MVTSEIIVLYLDVCQTTNNTSGWYGSITWQPTYAGYRRYVDCPYNYLRHEVASRDCIPHQSPLDGNLIAMWGEPLVEDCPGTPLNESLQYIEVMIPM